MTDERAGTVQGVLLRAGDELRGLGLHLDRHISGTFRSDHLPDAQSTSAQHVIASCHHHWRLDRRRSRRFALIWTGKLLRKTKFSLRVS